MKAVRHRWFFIAGVFIVFVLWIIFSMDFQYLLKLFNDQRRHNYKLKSMLPNKPIKDTLLDLKNFEFVMNNASICKTSIGNKSSILILVHTARNHFNQRYAIRYTWGSVKNYKGWLFHLAFLLGSDTENNPMLEARLRQESSQYGDMIMGNFVDSYKNLTYKHIMGYKWANKFCPNAKFILKADDDVYTDVFQLVEVLLVELLNSKYTYACQNMAGNEPIRETDNVWYVNEETYPEKTYPAFCSGSVYLIKAEGAAKIYSTSKTMNFFWIDDVFVTGLIREKYNILMNNTDNEKLDILTSNTRYNLYDRAESLTWCDTGFQSNQLKYTFILLDKNGIVHDMFCIWNKVRLMKFAMNHAVSIETIRSV